MAIVFPYNDPIVALEKFFGHVRTAYAKRTSDVSKINSEWDDGTFKLMSSTGEGLDLNLLTPDEYGFIVAAVGKFNREEIPRPCEFT